MQTHQPDRGAGPLRPLLSELLSIGFVTLDRQGRIRDVNAKAARLLGFSSRWLINRPFVVFVAKTDTTQFLSLLMQAARHSERHIFELHLSIDHSLIPVQIGLTSSVGESVSYQMEILDLSDTKDAEAHLRQTLAQWYSVVLNAPDTIMTVDRTGKIMFVNKPFLGYSVPALIGTSIYDYVPQAARTKLRRCMALAFRNGKRSSSEVKVADQEAWLSFSFGPSDMSTPDEMTTTVFVRDITEQKRSEVMLRASGEQLRDLTARVEAVREEEKARIAREIHDELGQSLTILKLDLAWVQRNVKGSANGIRKKLTETIAEVDRTINRVRRISSELRPSILDDAGLIAAIEWHAVQIQKLTGIRIKIRTDTDTDTDTDTLNLSPEASLAVFRVVQEALTNVIRHAKASLVHIDISLTDHVLRISLSDNGQGITQNQLADPKSLGLLGMRERLTRVGGDLHISSLPRHGTRLEITIPTL